MIMILLKINKIIYYKIKIYSLKHNYNMIQYNIQIYNLKILNNSLMSKEDIHNRFYQHYSIKKNKISKI